MKEESCLFICDVQRTSTINRFFLCFLLLITCKVFALNSLTDEGFEQFVHQIDQLKKENHRLEKYRDQRDALQDKVRELERDKRDLEYEANKRSTIQEIGELLKDKEIREMGLGLLAGNGTTKGLNGFQSEAKNRLQGWLQECSEDEAQGILNVLILAGDQYPDSASFNEEIGGVIQKHITQYQENQPTH